MAFHHVLATLGREEKVRMLFADLTSEELAQRFIKPYEQGKSFFAGNELISPYDLRSIHIIRTQRSDKAERDDINRKEREAIDRFNMSGSGLVVISAGAGDEPREIAGVGEDLTHTLIKGPPGFRAKRWQGVPGAFKSMWGIVATIIGTVVSAGIVWWLKWR